MAPTRRDARPYADSAVLNDDRYGCSSSFNRLTPAWYLNDSRTNLNVRSDENYAFFAIRDINRGEELTVDYSQFSDENPASITRTKRTRSK